jgi:hypothetical protein
VIVLWLAHQDPTARAGKLARVCGRELGFTERRVCRRWGNLDSVQRVEVSGSCGTHGNFSSVVRYVKMHVYADYDMDYVLANDVIFAWVRKKE